MNSAHAPAGHNNCISSRNGRRDKNANAYIKLLNIHDTNWMSLFGFIETLYQLQGPIQLQG